MKQWLLCILLFAQLLQVRGQKLYAQTISIQKVADSANATLSYKRVVADSLFNLGSKYLSDQDYYRALALIASSLDMYLLTGDRKKVGDCYNRIAAIYYYTGNYSKAVVAFEKGGDAFKKIGNEKGVAQVLNNIGNVYESQGNYLRALDSYKRAAVIFEEIKSEENLANAIQNMGLVYAKVKDFANAMKYFNQAYSVFELKNDQEGVAKVLNNIGNVKAKQNKYNEAFENLNKSLRVADTRRDKQLQIMALSSLGDLFYKKSDYVRALPYYTRSLTYANQITSLESQAEAQIAIGNISHQTGKNKDAVEKCQDGLKVAEKLGSIPMEKRGCECLYHSYKSSGNNQQALDYYERANAFDDSLNLTETANKVMGMEFQKQQLVDSLANVKKEHTIELKHKEEVQRKEKQRNMIIVSLCFMLLIAIGLWSQLNYVRKSRAALTVEKDRSEALLLNILPAEIAEELKAKGSVSAKDYDLVSVLFTDFKSFTQTAEKMSPQSLVEEINICFQAFDLITEKYRIEKIKTIGDAYMAAGGLTHADEHSLKNVVLAGLDMQTFMIRRAEENKRMGRPAFEMRLGIHAGPIVAGIVGVKKFQYDVWGDTVNTASRMESSSIVGKVNISETLYQFIKDEACFSFEHRGSVNAKGKGDIAMYFVEKSRIAQVA